MDNSVELGLMFKTIRKEKKMTLKQLSDKSGVSYSQIAKIEKGIHFPPKETIIKLAKGLSANELVLLDFAGYKVPENTLNSTNNFNEIDYKTKYNTIIKFNFTCQICGAKAPSTEITIDFIKPLKYGGSVDMDNTVVLCSDCKKARNEIILNEGIDNDYLYKQKK